MRLDVSRCSPERYEEFLGIVSEVYNRGARIAPEEVPHRPWSVDYLATQDGRAVGGYRAWNVEAHRGEAKLPTGGIATVGVLTEARGQGIGGEMMRWALREMRDQGLVLAALYPFRESYYRAFGYETVGRRLRIKAPLHRLPKVRSGLPVRRLTASQVAELDACYGQFCRARSGSFVRTAEMWAYRLGKNPGLVYAVGDPIEGYAWTAMEGFFWEELEVSEIAWSTAEGYRGILAVLTDLCSNRSSLSWCEPSDSPFLAQYGDQGVSAQIERQIMYRVLDVPRALESLRAEEAGETTLEIDDADLPENRGPWNVQWNTDRVSVERTDRAEVKMGIRAFSQSFMGEPDVATLARMGQIEGDARGLAKLLTSLPVVCLDFF